MKEVEKLENEKKVLTVSYVRKIYKRSYKLEGILGCVAIIVGLMICCCTLLDGLTDYRFYIGIIFGLLHIIVGVLMILPKIKFLRDLSNGNFIIEEQKVSDIKVVEGDYESPDDYIIVFSDSRKFRYTESKSVGDLYEIKIGDACYLFTVNKKIRFVFNANRYTLNLHEFDYDNGVYRTKECNM